MISENFADSVSQLIMDASAPDKSPFKAAKQAFARLTLNGSDPKLEPVCHAKGSPVCAIN